MPYQTWLSQVLPGLLKTLLVLGVLSILVLVLDRFGILKKIKIERNAMILLFWRTQRGLNFVERLALKKKFWKIFGNIAVILSILAILGSFLLLAFNLKLIFERKVTLPGVVPIIPGIKIPGIDFYVPLVEGIIALATVLVAHELAHGIIARVENITLKSLGVILLTLIPIGAFAEPDEEEQKKAPRKSKLRLFAVGSFSNFIVAGVAFLLLTFLIGPALIQTQVEIAETVKGSPADGILQPGMIINGLNNQPIKDWSEFQSAMAKIQPGERIFILTNKGTYEIVTIKHPQDPNKAYIGIKPSAIKNSVKKILGEQLPLTIMSTFAWISILNFGIGIMNMLPLKPLDGGLILEECIKELHSRISRRTSKPISERLIGNIVSAITFITLALIVLNALGPMIVHP